MATCDVSNVETLTPGFVENFEDGGLGLPWFTAGISDWYVTNHQSHSGAHSATSGDITSWGSARNSFLRLTVDFSEPGSVSFWHRVASDRFYGTMSFYIDGEWQDNWDGEVPWAQVTFPVTAGVHTLKWNMGGWYVRDWESAWIDDIVIEGGLPL